MPELKAYFSFRHTLEYRVAVMRNRIAWIDYHKGQHELFIQDLPDGKRQRVLCSDGDDGQPLRLIDFSPSGHYLLLTQGAFSDDGLPCPNPRQQTIPPTGQLKLLDLDNHREPEIIAGAMKARVVPDDSAITWVIDGTVYLRAITQPAISKLFSLRGQIQEISWSANSRHLAFVCQRDEHSLLGIYTRGEKHIRWISPAFDRDLHPCWSPDSRHLAFIRFLGPDMDIAEKLFSEQADSFSVMLLNVDTGKVKPVWESSLEKPAGLSLQYGQRSLAWLGNQRLLFSHDSTGWDHIYQHNLSDDHCSPVTEGSWLVQDYSTNPTTNRNTALLAFSHNRKRRHQYALDVLDITALEEDALSRHKKLHLADDKQYWQPSPTADGRYLIYLTGNASKPCQVGVLNMETSQYTHLPDTGDYKQVMAEEFLPATNEVIRSQDRNTCHGQLFKPRGKGPFPAVLNIHGGPWLQSLPGFHPKLDLSFQYAFCQLLAHCGFMVLDINYRGASGYGKLFRQAAERGWDGASDYQDVQAAGHWLSRQPDVDRTRIGILGESWGGYLSAMALAKDSSLFRAGVVINGCHSFPRELRKPHWASRLFNSDQGEIATEAIARAKIAEDSSPWGWLEHWMSPVLLVHGDDDRTVSFSESQYLAHALRCQCVEVETLALPDEGHQFLLHESWLKAGRRTLAFLQKHLQD
ncbi:S9 family peptidase [Sansalvadorimonas verongulae]|uniref:S9 family peptidase n=1 Tax=Sansalvadorimonas verongulae TaxID=2172824 RepID=UPI0012BCB063|nr:prolyl oligopeptidase family serine peptidase [Sansalvadorimonas verongulae]MTI15581.1 S9 family peptidase [Sansalvadorimonas verongulae]